jgi:hypothetical protein
MRQVDFKHYVVGRAHGRKASLGFTHNKATVIFEYHATFLFRLLVVNFAFGFGIVMISAEGLFHSTCRSRRNAFMVTRTASMCRWPSDQSGWVSNVCLRRAT